jgi:predicted GIY-YIG superfamily endonuclease
MVTVTRVAMGKAAEQAKLRPNDYRVYLTLLSRADRYGKIPDSRQPRTVEVLAKWAKYGTASAGNILRHLELHGWVTRTKGLLAGYAFTRYAVAIGSECDCPGSQRIHVPMTEKERARRCRDRKLGLPVDPPAEPGGRTAVYRMYASDGSLLYIGISNNFGRRWLQHEGTKPWWPEMQRQTVDWFPTRAEASREEEAAIAAERPKYNIAHALKDPPAEAWDPDEDEVLWQLYTEQLANS